MKKALFRLTCDAGLKLIKDGYRFDRLYNNRNTFWLVLCRKAVLKIHRKSSVYEKFKNSYVD